MNQNLLSSKGLDIIRTNEVLAGRVFAEDFILSHLLDKQEAFRLNIHIENCIFNKNFVAHLGDYYGEILLKNCVFKGLFILHALTVHNALIIENGHFMDTADLDCGTFYGKVEISNCLFLGFVNFQDQDIRGQASFLHNQFKAGTNLLHPKGGPGGAHFAVPPYLEGNTGLERYERTEGV